eukprot:scaffold79921_cov36-Tisochrysis_lutea.AAC.2
MDQRNAGKSARCPLGNGWQTYLDDQLALLDRLGCETSLTLGCCIGPSFQLRMNSAASDRVSAAVLLQPIGMARHTVEKQTWTGLNTGATSHWFDLWANDMERNGRASRTELMQLEASMFGSGFVFSVSREEVASIHTPMLVAPGSDVYHPCAIAHEIVALSPRSRLLDRQWTDTGEATFGAIVRFLREHAASQPFHEQQTDV